MELISEIKRLQDSMPANKFFTVSSSYTVKNQTKTKVMLAKQVYFEGGERH